MKSIGIDIGSSSIKVVEATANNKGQVRIANYHIHTLNTTPAHDSELDVIEFLKGMVAKYDPASTKICFALRQSQVAVRHKYFPFSDRLKIAKSLPFELEEDLPFPAEDSIFDSKTVRTIGNTAEVVACATPKSKVEAFLRKFGELGFDISLLSAEGIAFANCFENWFDTPPAQEAGPEVTMDAEAPQAPRNLTLVLNIGHTSTLVLAFDKGRLLGVRSILWGGKNLVEAVSRKYELPYQEAIKEIQAKGFVLLNRDGASYDQIVFSDTLSEELKILGQDLKISILELKADLNAIVDSAVISGGVSQLLNIQGYLTQALEVPVNKSTFLDHFNNLPFERSPQIEASIGVALGIAIEGLKKPRNPALQFLRGEFAKQTSNLKKLWAQWGRTAQFAAAMYVLIFVYGLMRDSTAQTLADRAYQALKQQAKDVAHLPAKTANESGVQKYISEKKNRIRNTKAMTSLSHMNSAMDILLKINDGLPPKSQITLNVKRIDISDGQVEFEASLASPAQVGILDEALKKIASDNQINKRPPTVSVPQGTTAYAAAFKVDRGIR